MVLCSNFEVKMFESSTWLIHVSMTKHLGEGNLCISIGVSKTIKYFLCNCLNYGSFDEHLKIGRGRTIFKPTSEFLGQAM